MSTNFMISMFAAATALTLGAGCNGTECADGTIEQDGQCVPATDDPSAANCGAGTVLGDSGQCEAEVPPTVCDEATTIEDTTTVPGFTLCVGTGTGAGCDSPLACPSAGANKVTVCGRLFNIDDDSKIDDGVTDLCDLATPDAAGPCHLSIKFYDALDFAGNPTGAVALTPQNFKLDHCGRFVAENIPRPSLGFLGIGVDDNGAPDDYRLTGVAFPVTSGQVRNGQNTYVVKETTNMAWSTDTDVNFGTNTFVNRGVFMSIFKHGTAPVPGVTVTSNGSVRAADDYYFTDTVATTRLDTNPAGPTGANGAALLLNSSLVEHSGTGGEPSGCVWPSDLAASIPGVLFFNPRVAETAAGAACP